MRLEISVVTPAASLAPVDCCSPLCHPLPGTFTSNRVLPNSKKQKQNKFALRLKLKTETKGHISRQYSYLKSPTSNNQKRNRLKQTTNLCKRPADTGWPAGSAPNRNNSMNISLLAGSMEMWQLPCCQHVTKTARQPPSLLPDAKIMTTESALTCRNFSMSFLSDRELTEYNKWTWFIIVFP